jgi:hypothetical protein
MATRKTYSVQSAVGQNETAYAFNSATRKGEAMLRDWAQALGLTGLWAKTGFGIERNASKVVTHSWRTYRHEATGQTFRFVVNLVP